MYSYCMPAKDRLDWVVLGRGSYWTVPKVNYISKFQMLGVFLE